MQPILDCIAICTIKLLGIEFQACLQHHFPRSVQEPDPIAAGMTWKQFSPPKMTMFRVFPRKPYSIRGQPFFQPMSYREYSKSLETVNSQQMVDTLRRSNMASRRGAPT